MKITQFFNREQRKLQEFSRKNNGLRTAKHQQVFVFGVFRPLVYMLYIVSVLALFLLGAKGALDGKEIFGQIITSEVIVAFYLYISKFFNPIQSLAEQFNFLQSAFASAEKIFTVMDMQPEVVDAEDAIELQEIQGKIEFKNVWFAYEDEEWILRDVSFVIEAKQTVALVGATGSGKTTILSLICRNYDIQKGQILIDGIDVKKIKIASLRKHFGQMLQDVFLFSGTIRQNIVLREDSISDDEVWQACKYVHADSFISKLSKGLDYEILENGNNFSAGQRQLISFARAIVHDPKVIILDEATANIDTETEQLIQHSLEKMMSIGTMIIVAHRLSTVQHADKIIVLSHGQIIEEGTHFELLKKQGSYYQLYTLQSQKESLSRE
jgi:ATP-binding cassette subfamily B protein